MLKKFYPDALFDRVQDIDLELLRENNIKGLILDIDNTLVPLHVKEADESAVKWIEDVKQAGFKVCIVSNASKKRVIKFNEKLRLYAIHRASKPGSKAFKKAARLIDVDSGNMAVIGDQVFTDVFGGNRVGMFTILVKPIYSKEYIFIKTKRFFEKIVLKGYYKKEDLKINNKYPK